MCGIAGWIGTVPEREGLAECMARLLHHRGPDAYGVSSWPEATLVHTRLSIIDLSPAGAQPISNEDGTVWAVFNGEIYNHRELRRGLEARGHQFRGRSDSEVLPHLYEEEGTSFVAKLRGMFALAIYDSRNRTLILVRDRFGIKPLFYSQQSNRLIFTSEIRPLLSVPGVDRHPDRQAIHDFAALYYIPAPQTFYEGIRALQPGEILEAQLSPNGITCKTRAYHQWTIAPNAKITLAEATERADALITAAVRRQMESDVPLGSLLSGGIDSSLVSSVAQQAAGEIRTFNVQFPDKEYDETWAAVAVAKHIGSRHETLHMGEAEGCWEEITELFRHAGQPFADTSLFAVNAVCRLVRQHITVALSGDGGDEGFGGYSHYFAAARTARMQRLPASVCNLAALILTPLAQLAITPRHWPNRILDLVGADDTDIVENLFCLLDRNEHATLCRDGHVMPVRRLFERKWDHALPETASRLDRLSAHVTEVNTRLTLPNDFLFKVDTASMRESLEVRVPMLDEDLFDFALSLPHDLKAKHGTGKRVLREVARRKLPTAVAQKPKMGFALPVDTWLGEDPRQRLKDLLLGPFCSLPEFFRPETYRPWVESFCNGHPDPHLSRREAYRRVMMLLSVQLALANRS